jgi:hypothetical protein
MIHLYSLINELKSKGYGQRLIKRAVAEGYAETNEGLPEDQGISGFSTI